MDMTKIAMGVVAAGAVGAMGYGLYRMYEADTNPNPGRVAGTMRSGDRLTNVRLGERLIRHEYENLVDAAVAADELGDGVHAIVPKGYVDWGARFTRFEVFDIDRSAAALLDGSTSLTGSELDGNAAGTVYPYLERDGVVYSRGDDGTYERHARTR